MDSRRAVECAVLQHGVLVGQGLLLSTGSATQQPWHTHAYRRNGRSPARRASVVLSVHWRARSRRLGACLPLSFLPRRGVSRPAVRPTEVVWERIHVGCGVAD
jgi:hypothetical protein